MTPSPIPTSSRKRSSPSWGSTSPEIDRIIRMLKDAHKIFTFEIIKEDPDNDIKRVDGYVETDLQTIRKLKNYFQKLLMDEYEKQFNKRLLVHQIVKDMYARPQLLQKHDDRPDRQQGDHAGRIRELHRAQFQRVHRLLEIEQARRNCWRMTENKLLRDTGWSANGHQEAPARKAPAASQRAVDSPQYQNYSIDKSKQSLDKVLQIYGVEFFFRIQSAQIQLRPAAADN